MSHSLSRKETCVRVHWWTGSLWPLCPQTVNQLSAQCSDTRKTVPGSQSPVQSTIDYNMFMGGVDRGDQLRGYYHCRTKCRKFYKYIFYFLFDAAITNAFILQKHFCRNPPHKTILEFRLQLAKELIGNYCSGLRPGCGASVVRSLPLPLSHHHSHEWPQPVSQTQERQMFLLSRHQEMPHGHILVLSSVMFGCATQQTVSCCGTHAIYMQWANCCYTNTRIYVYQHHTYISSFISNVYGGRERSS